MRPLQYSRDMHAHSGGFTQHHHPPQQNREVYSPFTPTFIHVTSLRAPGQAEKQALAPQHPRCGHQGKENPLPRVVRKQRQDTTALEGCAAPSPGHVVNGGKLLWSTEEPPSWGVTQNSKQELGDTQKAPEDTQLTPTKARADGSHLLCWVSQHAGHSRNSSKAFCCLQTPVSF